VHLPELFNLWHISQIAATATITIYSNHTTATAQTICEKLSGN